MYPQNLGARGREKQFQTTLRHKALTGNFLRHNVREDIMKTILITLVLAVCSLTPSTTLACDPRLTPQEKEMVSVGCAKVHMDWSDAQTKANCDPRQTNFEKCRAYYEKEGIQVGVACLNKMQSTKCQTWQ